MAMFEGKRTSGGFVHQQGLLEHLLGLQQLHRLAPGAGTARGQRLLGRQGEGGQPKG